ncbi:MAG TPA: baseplate J/gp47 family protein [Verrucomicrobiota bacterium]|nr:hypothetical protein [Verrucomicrobiales bacterium]HRI12564.1 baseplate J/gp47 family protein [Verrucomicrobiota bacterium]
MSSGFQQWRNDGTPQNRRFLEALDGSYFKIDDRTPAEYLRMFAAMAEMLRLDESNSWRELVPAAPTRKDNGAEDWQAALDQLERRRDNPPHLALFVSFVRLFRHVQDHLNTLTRAHLDHYYRMLLGFQPHSAKPDHLSVFPTLAKGVAQHLLPVGTALDGGRDAEGNPLVYLTESEIVVTSARVARLMATRVTSGLRNLRVSPVANYKDGLGSSFEKGEPPMWPAFGPIGSAAADDQAGFGFGFAITSPLLFLREGTRTIRLTLGVTGMDWKKWKAYLSAVGGWQLVTNISGDSTMLNLVLDANMPAIVAADPKVHADSPVTEWPVLKVYSPTDLSSDAYRRLLAALITKLEVEVEGVTSLKLNNDIGPLDSSRPFQPFGPRPVVGSTFAIESEETRLKPIQSWTPHFEWQGKPDKFVDYTSAASASAGPTLPDSTFTVSCPLSDDPGLERALFSTAEIVGPLSSIQLMNPPGAFGHSQYPARLSEIATNNAAGIAQSKEKPFTPVPLPPEPYTPTLKSFALSYRAELVIGGQRLDDPNVRLFRLHPFGIEPIPPSTRLLSSAPSAGSLYIGIADGDLASRLHLHFAVIEGSGKRLPEGQTSPPIQWSYLSTAGWVLFSSSDVQDGTGGLTQPGIVSFEPKTNATDIHPFMPAGFCWIQATVDRDPESVCLLSTITAQAVRATLQKGDGVPIHLRSGSRDVLPAGTVKGLVVPDPAIASVAQPFTSYGGRPAEDANGFYCRVSERLRHRNRAVTAWDYERIVLQAFPEIYKVLCVRAGPGAVKVVVVPRSARASWYDRLQPRPAPALKQEIEQHLRALSSGMTSVSVIDPDYEALQISCAVAFVKGKSSAACKLRLNEELQRFLTPWAYDDSQEIVFGGRIHQSVIQSFIDGRDYVEHFTEFKLVQNPSSADGLVAPDPPIHEAKATHLWSILVSARQHLIHLST